ncbi:MAG: isoprenylcysteine carboxylmethyltransferase family protein [candidate division Zixibacteria bacterium]|nr:isoprenylcysteine carboxylmethyltransferase family protein [candidate division Zixibacteria bacterium]
MTRMIGFLFGLASYAVFLASFLYAIGFVGDLVVPKTIDSGSVEPFVTALAVNAILLGLFAIQHSVMARPGFKRLWTKIVPTSIERSVYVLLSSLLLFLLYWQWRPMPEMVWEITNGAGVAVMWGLFGLGWLIVLTSTFLINHFDLFGLRQVLLNLRRQAYTPVEFKMAGLYKFLRHPIMLGFIIAFWATPAMSVGHLLFAVATTGYIIVGILLEERDLVQAHGQTYMKYRRQVPMLIPGMKSTAEKSQ